MSKLLLPGRIEKNLRKLGGDLLQAKGRANRFFNDSTRVMSERARSRLLRAVDPQGRPHKRRGGLTRWRAGGSKPGSDTGTLFRSIRGQHAPYPKGRRLYWGSPLRYARTYEEGATIRPKRVRYLTIPLTLEAKRHSAREFEDTFVIKTKLGHLFIARKKGKGLEMLYALLPKVVIPGRSFLPMSRQDEEWLDRELAKMVDEGVSNG